MTPKLLIGCAVYDDFFGLWPTLQSLRLYHAEAMPRVELAVVDNNPSGPHAQTIREFLGWLKGDVAAVHYLPYAEAKGTAGPRDALFRLGSAPAVLCMDSHVFLYPGALARLLDWYDAHPDSQDLYQGPMVYDDLKNYATHFSDVWGDDQMWGKWAGAWRLPSGTIMEARERGDNAAEFFSLPDGKKVSLGRGGVSWAEHASFLFGLGAKPAGEDADEAPFEIPAMGLGLFTCRREAWLGFNPGFRGFGGEEWYIHEKFRQAGRKTWCLPFLKWLHRFGRPGGVTYPLQLWDKARNYVLGHQELGLSLDRAEASFVGSGKMSRREWDALLAGDDAPPAPASDCNSCGGAPAPAVATLPEMVDHFQGAGGDISEHLSTLRDLAGQCRHVTEFAHRPDASTAALLAGQPDTFRCYGPNANNTAAALANLKGETDYAFAVGDSLQQDIEETDLLFLDTVPHTADHLYAELARHAPKVRRWIVLHDTRIYGEQGEGGGPGLLPAVRRYLKENPAWTVKFHYHNNHGLLCLTRDKEEKKELPPLWKQGWNVLKASWRAGENVLKDYGPAAGTPLQEARLSLCTLCESRNEERCGECGCPVDKKTSWPLETCPLGKWTGEASAETKEAA